MAPHHTAKRGQDQALSAGDALVAWYRQHHRLLPWRARPGQGNDPYHVWLSEIMLQQTTVVTVISYYEKFLRLWPRVQDLAAADQETVLKEWAGLGYYARARNLHKCAQMVTRDLASVFPGTVDGLLDLPGIGPYTARAMASIAFGARVMPVDGNIERVMTRLHAMPGVVRTIKDDISIRAQQMLNQAPDVFPGDLAQGLMDLGATLCTPRAPKCPICPLRLYCAAYAAGTPEKYPEVAAKKMKPTRHAQVFVIENKKGEVMLTRRPQTGLLAGMLGFPGTEWVEVKDSPPPSRGRSARTARRVGESHSASRSPTPSLPLEGGGGIIVGQVRHSFTHFNLILDVVRFNPSPLVGEGGEAKPNRVRGKKQNSGSPHPAHVVRHPLPQGERVIWHPRADLARVGLPKVFLKVLPFIE